MLNNDILKQVELRSEQKIQGTTKTTMLLREVEHHDNAHFGKPKICRYCGVCSILQITFKKIQSWSLKIARQQYEVLRFALFDLPLYLEIIILCVQYPF